jgi:hypothetical protein
MKTENVTPLLRCLNWICVDNELKKDEIQTTIYFIGNVEKNRELNVELKIETGQKDLHLNSV